MREHINSGAAFGRAEIAHYVAALSDDLARLAGQSGLDVVQYLLQMIRLEAENLNQLEGD
jgi:hypothetical protein